MTINRPEPVDDALLTDDWDDRPPLWQAGYLRGCMRGRKLALEHVARWAEGEAKRDA